MGETEWILVFAGVSALADLLVILRMVGVFGTSEGEMIAASSKRKWLLPMFLFVVTMGLIGFGFYRIHVLQAAVDPNVLYPREEVTGRSYHNEVVDIDGKTFNHCRFENVTFRFHGVNDFTFVEPMFSGKNYLEGDTFAVKGTITLMQFFLGFKGAQSLGVFSENKDTGQQTMIVSPPPK